jgi:phage-related protein
MPTQAVFYRAPDGSEPVAEFLDREFPLEPRKKNPSARELQAAATKRVTIDLQVDRLNGLATDDPPLPFPHTSQINGPLRELRCHYGRAHYRVLYRRSGNLFVLLHMIRKTSKAVPSRGDRDRQGALAGLQRSDGGQASQAAPCGGRGRSLIPSDGLSSFAKLTT